ncbi:hypothetical protein K5L04_06990 [Flavobacterium psychrophilum]|uniref:hypothetical protein n=1 Tax=Flavobacterium psychrophilum TaxID=96345 RepID=UPI0010698863|nr:hypothetical protein [Flavobacterium psychrophilum]EKT4553264.1 hypothetical protein [Flavobacterium psychrophilum]ELY1980220.1 hypothetical protein [Flavobacterium psychrophilum]QZK99477.1 hypothetical protein K5L04_06990 [Flavobacterium psychrophilum]
MKIGLFILFGLYLFKLFQNRTKEKREYKEATQILFANVQRILGNDVLSNLKLKRFWVGMPQCLVLYSLGKPHKIINSQDKENLWETYYYGAKPYQYGGETKYRYQKEISFHNRILTNIKNN